MKTIKKIYKINKPIEINVQYGIIKDNNNVSYELREEEITVYP